VLHFIKSIGALLDRDRIAIANNQFQFVLLAFQDLFEFAQFSLRHFVLPNYSHLIATSTDMRWELSLPALSAKNSKQPS
jgi:hypothetical protein